MSTYVSTESYVTRDIKMYSNRVRPGLVRYSSLQGVVQYFGQGKLRPMLSADTSNTLILFCPPDNDGDGGGGGGSGDRDTVSPGDNDVPYAIR